MSVTTPFAALALGWLTEMNNPRMTQITNRLAQEPTHMADLTP